MKDRIGTETYFTPKQAAGYFNLSLSTIKNYIYAGRLKTLITPGGHHRISKSELLTMLEGGNDAPENSGRDGHLIKLCCNALLNTFKLLGNPGNYFLIHARSVSKISGAISKAMGLTKKEIEETAMTGLVHDIGHIGIERRVILKEGTLTPQEYELIKSHPVIGYEVINSINQIKDIAGVVRQHHERIDGSGYPAGLSGNNIHKAARIISIAEAYDSMVSEHSYKRPVSKEAAIAELMHNRGGQFDAEIVEVFVKMNP